MKTLREGSGNGADVLRPALFLDIIGAYPEPARYKRLTSDQKVATLNKCDFYDQKTPDEIFSERAAAAGEKGNEHITISNN